MVPRGDEEYAFSDLIFAHQVDQKRPKRCNLCLFYAIFLFVLLCVSLLIFSLVVLHPSLLKVRLTSAAVKTLNYGGNNNNTSAGPWFNGTMSGEVTIRNNNNFGRFSFGNSSATFSYGGAAVGEAELEGGSVEAKGEIKREVVVQFKSNGPIGDILKDGTLEFSGYARLVGEMRLIKNFFYFRRISVLSCTMSLNLNSSSIQDFLCH